MTDREILEQVTKALADLSFECCGDIGTDRPTVETYNRTFAVLEQSRKHIASDVAAADRYQQSNGPAMVREALRTIGAAGLLGAPEVMTYPGVKTVDGGQQ